MTSFPFGICAVYYYVRLVRGYIISGEAGLRWRGIGPEKRARWDEVSDYYFDPLKGRNSPTVETVHGSFNFNEWTNREDLKQIIASRARGAAAKEWETRGIRPCDQWPRTFSYNTVENRWLPVALAAVTLVFPFQIFISAGFSLPDMSRSLRDLWLANGTGLLVLLFAAMLVMMLAIPALLTAASLGPWQFAHAHRDESFTATPHHLTRRRGADSQTVDWAEVTDYYYGSTGPVKATNLFIIEIGTERWEWSVALKDARLLADIVRRYATATAAEKWASFDSQQQEARARALYASTGRRTFTFRNDETRALGVLLTCIGLLPTVAWALQFLLPPTLWPAGAAQPAKLFLPLAIVAWTWWRYLDASVTVDSEGISHKGPFGLRSVPWSELKSATPAEEQAPFFLRVSGRRRKLLFYAGIMGISHLREIIAGHFAERTGP